jgi:hypothetical protein
VKLRLVAVATAVLAGLAGQRPLQACGDKFLLPPRGLSFEEAYRAAHPGLVVLYIPGQRLGPGTEYAKVQSLLTRAGHRVVVAQSKDQLDSALAQNKTDIIVTSFSEAATAGAGLDHWPIGPVILPVLTAPTKAQKTACKQAYPCLLESKDKPERFVAVANEVMNDRVKALDRKRGH